MECSFFLIVQVLVLYTGGTIGMVRNKDGVLVPQPHAMENKIRAMCTMHDEVECLPLNRITLGLHKSDNTNRMIQLTDVLCKLLRYNGTSNI